MKFKAVTKAELVRILGNECSPDYNCAGYVIGPDINGRLCQVASCTYFNEAKRYAEQLNAKYPSPEGQA